MLVLRREGPKHLFHPLSTSTNISESVRAKFGRLKRPLATWCLFLYYSCFFLLENTYRGLGLQGSKSRSTMEMTDGLWVAYSIWGMNGIIFMILLLRLYTRIKYTTMYGMDDFINMAAFVSLPESLHPAETSLTLRFGQGALFRSQRFVANRRRLGVWIRSRVRVGRMEKSKK